MKDWEDRWLGEEKSRGGSYHRIDNDMVELTYRYDGKVSLKKPQLLRYESPFNGKSYYISSPELVEELTEIVSSKREDWISEAESVISNAIVEYYGISELIGGIKGKIKKSYDEGYRNGKLDNQFEIRKALGIRSAW
jgi:hypothetical protein